MDAGADWTGLNPPVWIAGAWKFEVSAAPYEDEAGAAAPYEEEAGAADPYEDGAGAAGEAAAAATRAETAMTD